MAVDSELDSLQSETTKVKALFESFRANNRLVGVRDVEVDLTEETSGDIALSITFIVDRDLKPSPEKIANLDSLARHIRSELLRQNIKLWPYIHFREA